MSRPSTLPSVTTCITTGCGKIYITKVMDGEGITELFITLGKAGGCAAAQLQAIGRAAALALRYGAPLKELIEEIGGINCHAQGEHCSCPDAIAQALKEE